MTRGQWCIMQPRLLPCKVDCLKPIFQDVEPATRVTAAAALQVITAIAAQLPHRPRSQSASRILKTDRNISAGREGNRAPLFQ